MRDFEIVAIVLVVFLGFGIATGVLIVSMFPRRRVIRYQENHDWEQPPEEDNKPRRWPGDSVL